MKKRAFLILLTSIMLTTPVTAYTLTYNPTKVDAISKPIKAYFPRRFWGTWQSKYRTIKINRYGVFGSDFGKHHHKIYLASDHINNEYNSKGKHSSNIILWYCYEHGYTAYTPEGSQPVFFKISKQNGKKVLLLQVAASQEIFHKER